jgi:hypothetical protein
MTLHRNQRSQLPSTKGSIGLAVGNVKHVTTTATIPATRPTKVGTEGTPVVGGVATDEDRTGPKVANEIALAETKAPMTDRAPSLVTDPRLLQPRLLHPHYRKGRRWKKCSPTTRV